MTIRVAVERAVSSTSKFVVRRLDEGQPLPANAKEAMLVFTGEVNDFNPLEHAKSRARRFRQAVTGKGRHVLSEIAARCRAIISHYGKRALRRVGLTVLPSPGNDNHV